MSVATVCRARRHMIREPETPETIECVSGGKAASSLKKGGGGGGSHVTGGDRALVAMEQHPLNFSPTIFGIIMHFGPITAVCCLLAKSSSNFSQLREVVMETDHFPPY